LLSDDDFHPSMQGHENWANEILIPYLTDKAILQ
jgi:lysophospholipase L1-like esterase